MSSPAIKPLPLTLRGIRIDPARRQEREMSTSVVIPLSDYQRLTRFIAAVHKRTGRRVTQRSLMITALRQFLDRNRGWYQEVAD